MLVCCRTGFHPALQVSCLYCQNLWFEELRRPLIYWRSWPRARYLQPIALDTRSNLLNWSMYSFGSVANCYTRLQQATHRLMPMGFFLVPSRKPLHFLREGFMLRIFTSTSLPATDVSAHWGFASSDSSRGPLAETFHFESFFSWCAQFQQALIHFWLLVGRERVGARRIALPWCNGERFFSMIWSDQVAEPKGCFLDDYWASTTKSCHLIYNYNISGCDGMYYNYGLSL